MLFHITQTHTPETCPVDEGGSASLFNPNAEGIKLIGRYGANSEHILYFIVQADDWQALQRFLLPGFRRCTATQAGFWRNTPVSEIAITR